ncbi:hypothetical protein TNCV_2686661 [Trichonephila clavipes]|nr:hypothetical protein TNCV_2686661 [Trichonephila clavipes]
MKASNALFCLGVCLLCFSIVQTQFFTKTTNSIPRLGKKSETLLPNLVCLVRDGSGILYVARRKQTLAQITTQLNDGASHIVSKRKTQRSLYRMGIENYRPTRVPLLNARSLSGCTSCLVKRAQRLEYRGLKTNSME